MQRVWETKDDKVVPSDLVREQDFIMRVRRLTRLGVPHLVVNIVLNAFAKGQGAMKAAQDRLQNLTKTSRGAYAEMSNGDVFLLWPEAEAPVNAADITLQAAAPDTPPEANAQQRFVYRLPTDYTALRERANAYIEISRAAAIVNDESSPSQLLQSEAARGPLTAWSADQIGRLLKDIDLHRHVCLQSVFERQQDASWRPVFAECFIGFDELRRAHFPKMEIGPPEHLFLALCQSLDRCLLEDLTEHNSFEGQRLNLNLSVTSVLGTTFAQFTRRVPHHAHDLIGFELQPGDLLQNFALTLSAMNLLRREGFKVVIDGVTPDMLGYINLALFEADFIKINVSRDYAAQLDEATVRRHLTAFPPEKLVFYRCDSPRALAAGVDLGVTLFQGWLLDDLMGKKA